MQHPDIYQYKSYLFTIAYNMVGDVAAAEDLVQEAFIRFVPAGEKHWHVLLPTQEPVQVRRAEIVIEAGAELSVVLRNRGGGGKHIDFSRTRLFGEGTEPLQRVERSFHSRRFARTWPSVTSAGSGGRGAGPDPAAGVGRGPQDG